LIYYFALSDVKWPKRSQHLSNISKILQIHAFKGSNYIN
jgi:hypothetical protein